MAAAALKGLPDKASLREKMSHVWSNWMGWAVADPDKRRALAHLQGYLELSRRPGWPHTRPWPASAT